MGMGGPGARPKSQDGSRGGGAHTHGLRGRQHARISIAHYWMHGGTWRSPLRTNQQAQWRLAAGVLFGLCMILILMLPLLDCHFAGPSAQACARLA